MNTEVTFTPEQRQAILLMARATGAADINGTAVPSFEELGTRLGLDFVPGGVFVSYHIGKANRGCIGCFEADYPFWKLVQYFAIHACHDSRFPRMTPEEFAAARVEVSCLTAPVDIADPMKEVVIGKHGVHVTYREFHGTYLPQVIVEEGWDLEQLVVETAYIKAGIPYSVDVLHDPEVHWQTYTDTVVSE